MTEPKPPPIATVGLAAHGEAGYVILNLEAMSYMQGAASVDEAVALAEWIGEFTGHGLGHELAQEILDAANRVAAGER